MMKIGFSSLVYPKWDLQTIATNASSMGFDGIELRGLCGRPHLPGVGELADKPDKVRDLLQENNVELVCLSTGATLDSCSRRELAGQQAVITEYIELASKLRCPHVRISAGEVQRLDHHQAALARIAEALMSLVPVASRHNVTLLLENGGDFHGSHDLWHLCDAVEHPAFMCCWNQADAMTIRERPTTSIPRLGNKIGLVHLCDAEFDDLGTLLGYKPLGQGHVEIARQIELLKGLTYDRYLVFESPGLSVESAQGGPAPEAALLEVAKFLRQCIAAEQAVLSAYKGDKRPAKFASRRPAVQSPG